jgi:hypothetical protein
MRPMLAALSAFWFACPQANTPENLQSLLDELFLCLRETGAANHPPR